MSEAALPLPAERPRLRRRTEHRLVAGVAGGIADWLNAPVAFIRFFLAVAALSPWTIGVYAVAALVLPAAGRNRPDWDNVVGAARLGLLLGVPLLIPSLYWDEPVTGSAGWFVATYGLIGAGAAVLFWADYRRGRPRSRREARATVLAALPVAGCAAVVAAGVVLAPDVRWERFVPLVPVAGGLALLIWGSREFVAPMLVALVIAAQVVGTGARLDGGVGDLRVEPADPVGDPIVVRRAAGNVEVELRRLGRSPTPVDVDVSLGRGDLRIELPRGARVELHARVGRGRISHWSRRGYENRQGFDASLDRVVPGRRGRASLRVNAHVGLGTLHVSRSD